MTEPLIIGYGRSVVRAYPEGQYLLSLEHAFLRRRADFIVLDDNPRGQKFLAACVAWAVDQEYLYCSGEDSDGQSSVSTYRLTEKGRRVILEEGCQPAPVPPSAPV